MAASSPLRLGTRASVLARLQTAEVIAALQAGGTPTEEVLITTQGDRDRTSQPAGDAQLTSP